jgi:hypothetical protein
VPAILNWICLLELSLRLSPGTNKPECIADPIACRTNYERISLLDTLRLARSGHDIERKLLHILIRLIIPVIISNVSGTTVFGLHGLSNIFAAVIRGFQRLGIGKGGASGTSVGRAFPFVDSIF